MPARALPGGIGAVGTAMARFFHPSQKIREKWPQDDKRRINGALVVGEGVRRIRHKDQMCYLVRIGDIDDNTVFHISKKNFKVTLSGPIPFESEVRAPAPPPAADAPAVDEQRTSSRNVVANVGNLTRGGTREEIEELHRNGITVDDDNEPAPENTAPDFAEEAVPTGGTWEKPTYCIRRANSDFSDSAGKFKSHRWDEIVEYDELELFRMCFPEGYVRDVVIPMTNKTLTTNMTLKEFYVWLGCLFFMACYEGVPDRDLWWSTKNIDMFDGAPFRLNAYMTKKRFKEITASIQYTDQDAPLLFVDRFHEVRQMIYAFNQHYEQEYTPSWLNCVDESMNSWLNKFAPGFMTLPRKPHPFGNEYHSIADGDGGRFIMWRIKLVEGKDRPKLPNGKPAFESQWERKYPKAPTVATLLAMTEPIHRTGKIVTGDSGFCVTQGVLALHDAGVFGQFLIKKRQHWPKKVPGDYIDRHMSSKPLGYTESYVQEIEGKRFFVHCTKDKDYVTKMMSTHGVLDEIQDHVTYRQVDGKWVSFKYAEYLSRHNRAKHWVDDVNNRRHDPIGLEQVWATKWWPNRQFTFICSIAEVNAGQARGRARKEPAEPTLQFRKQLALKMLTNNLDSRGVVPTSPMRLRRTTNSVHVHKKRDRFAGRWNPYSRKFNECKTEYVRRPCSVCRKTTREYCACAPERDLCRVCFGLHLLEHEG